MVYYRTSLRFAGVAQLVEQLICNQQVGGSSPSTSSIFLSASGGLESPDSNLERDLSMEHGSVPEWPKGADCKSVGTAYDGSNPSAPTKNPSHESVGDFFFLPITSSLLLVCVKDFW